MRLVFVHGWGCDAAFWDETRRHLQGVPQTALDLGYFGAERLLSDPEPGDILVGHSLGFAWGLDSHKHWERWISVNGFCCFASRDQQRRCVAPSIIRAMQMGLKRNASKTLTDFRDSIGMEPIGTPQNDAALADGLAFLAEVDVSASPQIEEKPGLILASKHDSLVPSSATDHLASQARNGRLVWCDETSGHILPRRAPEWCAIQINRFIS